MKFIDKVAVANTLAAYLDDTQIDLSTELRDRGLSYLIGDDEFARFLSDRVTQCEGCGAWVHVERYCDCGEDDEDWDYA